MASYFVVATLPVFILVLWAVLQPTKLTHHKVLGIRNNASDAEIQSAYNKLKMYGDAKVEQAFYILSDTYRRRDYEVFGLDSVKDVEGVNMKDVPSLTPSLNKTNFEAIIKNSTLPLLIQIFSVANRESREFSPVWEKLVESLKDQVNLVRIELGEIEAVKLLAGKSWIKRHGVPALVATPVGCKELKCLIRYFKDMNYQSILDWTATQLNLPRILYYSSQTLGPDFIQKSGAHKVKVIFFSDTGERALPFVREMAKKYNEYTSFGCALWRPEEAYIWKSRLGVESAPAVVFLKDPGLQPVIQYGEMTRDSFIEALEEHKTHVLPQLRSITAGELGCDASSYSAAGKDVLTWYCVIVAGKPGFQLDQLRSTMRMLQDELSADESDNTASAAYKTKRLSLSWLDGEAQKNFCYFCLSSETVQETCGPRQVGEQDKPRIFMVRFRRDPNRKLAEKKTSSLWSSSEQQDLASVLIARYNGANDVSEVLPWISGTVRDGDTNEIPFFDTKAVPVLVPEDKPTSVLTSTRNSVSQMGWNFIEKVQDMVLDIIER